MEAGAAYQLNISLKPPCIATDGRGTGIWFDGLEKDIVEGAFH